MFKQIGFGKIRDLYDLGDSLIVVTSDNFCAEGIVLPYSIPKKGEILNKLSEFWFNYTQDLIPNHMITTNNLDMPSQFRSDVYQGRCMKVKKLSMLSVECVVRGYISGLGWESYVKTGEVSGIKLPTGIKESEKLPYPIYTPIYKNPDGLDQSITFEQSVNILGEELATQIKDLSLKLYQKCSACVESKSMIVADTKFKFGLDSNGTLMLGDEILTPDSSRFWNTVEYEVGKKQKSFDKHYLMNWLQKTGWNNSFPAPEIPERIIRITSGKYNIIYERLTEESFI